jgi:hypothetical protein
MNSSVGIATGYVLEGRAPIPGGYKRFFSTPRRPDGLWAIPAYPMGTANSLPGGKAART